MDHWIRSVLVYIGGDRYRPAKHAGSHHSSTDTQCIVKVHLKAYGLQVCRTCLSMRVLVYS